jgi:pSer/pThr/pTyr-binding forkhead associated (FHA) protein
MEWQTLAELARECAALPKSGFKARFPTPFLLQVDWEEGVMETDSGGETRSFSAEKIGDSSPSLTTSRILNFGEGQAFELGRGDGVQIAINHDTVSDKHCKFESFGSIWSIQELGSKNGTYLNGRKMADNEQSPLKFGTKIRLGDVQFQFLGADGRRPVPVPRRRRRVHLDPGPEQGAAHSASLPGQVPV